MKLKVLSLFLLLISSSISANQINEFWKAEALYLENTSLYVSQLYDKSPNLIVIEYAIKRDPTKMESEADYFIFLKALDKNDITDISDPVTKQTMESEGFEAKEIAVYTAIFDIPKKGFVPEFKSISQRRTVLNNKWAAVVGKL